MPIRLRVQRESAWQIRAQEQPGVSLLEITDHPRFVSKNYLGLYIGLLERVFADCAVVALSQWVDVRQWRESLPDGQAYASAIGRRFSVQAAVTASYDEPDPPTQPCHAFVVHVAGHLDRRLLQEVLAFGMCALPNIAYGMEHAPEQWLQETLSRNRTLVRWFRLQESDEVLADLSAQVELLFWTGDSHLWFATSCPRGRNRIMAHVENLAETWRLRPAVDSIT